MAGVELATAYVSILPDTSKIAPGITRALAGAEAGAATSGKRAGNAYAQGMSGGLTGIGKNLAGTLGAMAGITAVTAGLKTVIGVGNDFTNNLNTMQAVSGATAAQMATVSEKARQLGNDMSLPSTSASDAAAAMTELAKGGFDVSQSMAAAKGTLQLAAAAQMDAAQAATIQSNALHAFGLNAGDAARAADILANTANASSAEISDVAYGLQASGAVAHQFGVSIEDTATALAMFSNAGINGSDAGTLLKSALLALTDQSNPAQGAIEELGLTVYDAQGKFVGLQSLFGQLQTAASKMTPEMYQAATTTLFGSDAARLAGIAAEQGADGFAKLETAVTKQGGAAEVAAAKTQGLPGAMSAVQNSAETLGLGLYDLVKGPLEGLAKGAANFISDTTPGFLGALKGIGGAIGALPPQVTGLVGAFATLKVTGLGDWLNGRISSGVSSTAGAFKNFTRDMGSIDGVMGRVKGAGKGLLDFFGGPWVAGFLVAGAAITGLIALHDKASAAAKHQKEMEDALRGTLSSSGQLTGESLKTISEDFQKRDVYGRAQTFGIESTDFTRAAAGLDEPGRQAYQASFQRTIQQNLPGAVTDTSGGSRLGTAIAGAGISQEQLSSALAGDQAAIDSVNASMEKWNATNTTNRISLGGIRDMLPDVAESASVLGSEMNGTNEAFNNAASQWRKSQEEMNGLFQLTEKGAKTFGDLGIAVKAVPNAKEVVIDMPTEEQRKKLEELHYQITDNLNGTATVTLDDAGARAGIQQLVKAIEDTRAALKLDPRQAEAAYAEWAKIPREVQIDLQGNPAKLQAWIDYYLQLNPVVQAQLNANPAALTELIQYYTSLSPQMQVRFKADPKNVDDYLAFLKGISPEVIAKLNADPTLADNVLARFLEMPADKRAALLADPTLAERTVTEWINVPRTTTVAVAADPKAYQDTLNVIMSQPLTKQVQLTGSMASLLTGAVPMTPQAGGGALYGGVRGRDSIPILGMPGEHMLTVDDVNAMGGQDAVYAFRQALHMAGGGAVGNVQSGAYLTTDIQRSMWDWVRGRFPNASLNDGTRTIQTEGHPDFHNAGKAIDLGGPMQAIANAVAGAFPDSLELFWDPGPNIDEGHPTGAIGGHSDHVHWASAYVIGSAAAGSRGGISTVPLTQNPDGTWTSPNPAWAHLIARESGGNPSIVQGVSDANSGGNEASGLFQIAKGTWANYGGTAYAPTAGQATPQQQAAIAAKIFNAEGGGPWGSGLAGREDEAALRAGLVSGTVKPWTAEDELDLQRARNDLADAKVDKDKVDADMESTVTERDNARIEVERAQLKLTELENKKAGIGQTDTGNAPAPQIPAPTSDMSNEEQAYWEAYSQFEDANTSRNETYRDGSLAEQRVADSKYTEAKTKMEEAKAALDEARAANAETYGEQDTSGEPTTLKGILQKYAAEAAGVGYDAALEALPFGLGQTHWLAAIDAWPKGKDKKKRTGKDAAFLEGLPDWLRKLITGEDVTVADSGGWLEPGNFAVNLTNRPEPIFNSPEQLAQFAGDFAAGGNQPSLHIEKVVGYSPQEVAKEVMRQFRTQQMRHSGGTLVGV